MPVPSKDTDPLRSRLQDPAYARAYESWLEMVIERATKAAPRRRPAVTRPASGGSSRAPLAS